MNKKKVIWTIVAIVAIVAVIAAFRIFRGQPDNFGPGQQGGFGGPNASTTMDRPMGQPGSNMDGAPGDMPAPPEQTN